ncbi:hypothetical protein TIFTF001_032814 [Ficus carica]|uniref:Uncharacterized protein n=1 Tax=Ficus carica TaxID=3494 RepID=A0AA88J6X6_FICCA|nr:hypothetical protein TIFTF001_032814 [Ficus carica]
MESRDAGITIIMETSPTRRRFVTYPRWSLVMSELRSRSYCVLVMGNRTDEALIWSSATVGIETPTGLS